MAAVPIVHLGEAHFAELWHKCHMRGAVFEALLRTVCAPFVDPLGYYMASWGYAQGSGGDENAR